MNPKGNIFIAVGKRDTGKTVSALMLALHFRIGAYKKVPKRIIVLDHANNSSYKDITDIITVDDLENPLPKDAIVKVKSEDVDGFCYNLIHHVRNAVIVFDDAGTIFGGKLTDTQRLLLKTPKNNGLELIFQFHQFGGVEIPPDMLRMANMFIIKETKDNFNDLPDKVQPNFELRYCLHHVYTENKKRPLNQKYSTVFYDSEADKVGFYGENFKINWKNGNDFFPKRNIDEFKY